MSKCQICGNEITIIHDKLLGYQEPEKYKIAQCGKCNVSYAIPTKVNSKIYDDIYKNKSKIPNYNRYYKYMSKIKKSKSPLKCLYNLEDVYCSVIKCIEVYSKKHNQIRPKILEIGSGLGYLTYALNMSQYETLGIDISQNAVDKAINQFGNFYKQYDVLRCNTKYINKYDIIIMTEVIEHIEEPKEFLKATYSMLKQDGIVIMTTPNKSAYDKSNGVIWRTDLPPVHLWWFSEESINILAKELNFIKIDFFNVSKCPNAVYDYSYKMQELYKPVLRKNGEVIVYKEKKLALIKNIISKGIDILGMRIFYMEKIKLAEKNSKPRVMCVVLGK